MKRIKSTQLYLLLIAILGVFAIIGCAVPAVDTTAPTVESTVPAASATDVLIDGVVTATFDEAMDAATIVADNFTLAAGATAVAGAVSYDVDSKTATFTPDANLTNATEYTATIGVGVLDLAGNALESAHGWSFTTGTLADTTAPTLIATVPLADAIDVAANENITATFSEAMNAATIIAANFTLADGLTPVAGVVTYDAPSKTATFDPDSDLANDTIYTATITVGVTDSAGNAIEGAQTWDFTTLALAGIGPAPVLLGSAGNYVILAEANIELQATPTVVTGSIAVSPAALTLITGFTLTPHEVTPGVIDYATATEVVGGGLVYAADMTGGSTSADLTAAIGAKLAAYNDAVSRVPVPADFDSFLNVDGGLLTGTSVPLVPGLHQWGTGVSISGSITFSGGPNDVWILQVNGDLLTAAGSNVLLVGGALPKNIFWQVTGATDLGTGSHFEGVILSGQIGHGVWLLTGATMNGRVMSASQVVLQNATLTQPAP